MGGVSKRRAQAERMNNGTAAAPCEKMSAAAAKQTEEMGIAEKEVTVPNIIDFSDRLIELHVGLPATVLRVHEKVLLRSSTYLKPIIENTDALKVEPRVTIENHSVGVVSVYLHWLYTGLFAVILSTKILAESYLFGDRIRDTSFKNAVIKEFAVSMQTSKTSDIEEAAKILYQGTEKGSQARRFIVDMAINQACPEWKTMLSSCPRDLLVDILEVLLEGRTAPEPPTKGN